MTDEEYIKRTRGGCWGIVCGALLGLFGSAALFFVRLMFYANKEDVAVLGMAFTVVPICGVVGAIVGAVIGSRKGRS